jgi:uncharacterized membrane protein
MIINSCIQEYFYQNKLLHIQSHVVLCLSLYWGVPAVTSVDQPMNYFV